MLQRIFDIRNDTIILTRDIPLDLITIRARTAESWDLQLMEQGSVKVLYIASHSSGVWFVMQRVCVVNVVPAGASVWFGNQTAVCEFAPPSPRVST